MIDISSNDANEARAVFLSDYRGRFSDRNITNGSKRGNESVGGVVVRFDSLSLWERVGVRV